MRPLLALLSVVVLSIPAPMDARGDEGIERGMHYTIYLLGGQSNMDGRGKADDLTGDLARYAEAPDGVLIGFSSGGHKRKLRASEGLIPLQPGCNEKAGQFGPELGFGHAMAAAHPDRRLILLKVSEGGTNLREDWDPGREGNLFHRLVGLVRATREKIEAEGATCEVAGMIWHQGESDSGAPHAEAYAARLSAFIARLREELERPELPFVIGEICVENSKYQELIEAQREVAAAVGGVGLATSEGLTTHDANVHFDFRSLIELGERFARAMAELEGSER